MSDPQPRRRRLGVAGAVFVAMVGTPAVAMALDQHIVDNVNHFIECWNYMWTDAESHAKFCGNGPPPNNPDVVDYGTHPPTSSIYSMSSSSWSSSSYSSSSYSSSSYSSSSYSSSSYSSSLPPS